MHFQKSGVQAYRPNGLGRSPQRQSPWSQEQSPWSVDHPPPEAEGILSFRSANEALLLARRCMSEALLLRNISSSPSVCSHMWAVATRVNGSGCRLGWWVSQARYVCIRFWWWSSKGKGQFGGEYNAEMAYWSIIDSCVKSWQYFPTQNVWLNSVKEWLSYNIVRFKIELGVEKKFKCKNAIKQTQHGDTLV